MLGIYYFEKMISENGNCFKKVDIKGFSIKKVKSSECNNNLFIIIIIIHKYKKTLIYKGLQMIIVNGIIKVTKIYKNNN